MKEQKVQILVFEDEKEQRVLLEEQLVKGGYGFFGAGSAEEFFDILNKEAVDVIILDIMAQGEFVGLEIASELHRSHREIPFLFLTSITSKIIFDKARSFKPYQYLIKPFNPLELAYSIQLALESFYQQDESLSEDQALIKKDYFFVQKKQALVKVKFEEILYFESQNKYVDIVTQDHKFLAKASLKKVRNLLEGHPFKQSHRNFIVNMDHIKEVYLQDSLILMDNADRVPLSSRKKSEFLGDQTVFN